jgi:glutathione S-transferase
MRRSRRTARRPGTKPRQTSPSYDDLGGRLGVDDFFCGGFSYADIALFMAVLFVLRLNGPRLNAWPVLARWYARVGARPSVAVAAEEIAAADRELSPLLAH